LTAPEKQKMQLEQNGKFKILIARRITNMEIVKLPERKGIRNECETLVNL